MLAAALKKLQAREAKARPERFIETLFTAYELLRAKEGLESWIDQPLSQVYDILTLLPGSEKEYTLLDFTRDVYFLDASGITETKKGYELSLPASTASRERKALNTVQHGEELDAAWEEYQQRRKAPKRKAQRT